MGQALLDESKYKDAAVAFLKMESHARLHAQQTSEQKANYFFEPMLPADE